PDHPVQPPFPTRRSSDLLEGGFLMYPLPHHSVGFRFSSDLPLLTLKGAGLQYVDTPTYCWDNHNRRDEHCLIQFCLDGAGALQLDRKSTRLNSSHVSTAY